MRTIHIPGVDLRPYLAAAATMAAAAVGLLAIYITMPETKVITHTAAPSKALPQDAKVSLALAALYDSQDYTLANIRSGTGAVPTLSVTSLPKDIANVRDVKVKKSVFFRTLLPMVLQVNTEIKAERSKLLKLRNKAKSGDSLTGSETRWLQKLAKKYKTEPQNLKELVKRVDAVPVSLVLAQAAEESGWGTSRFARQGNALFGQWTWDKAHKGIVPAGREAGKTHRIRAFDSAKDAIAAYTLNLNTHRAYNRLRVKRASGASGYELTTALDKYSERGTKYVTGLQSIMKVNNLRPLDTAKLDTKTRLVLR